MSDLDALLAGIVADPHNSLRWMVLADCLEDHDQPERAELVRVHRELLRTCIAPDAHPERPLLHARMMELMRAGVQPCIPQMTLTLPGGVELRMSFIPPGSFLMGSPESEEGREEHETQHLVTLSKGFWLGQSPVTQRQWSAVMGENPSQFKGEELPVEMVSWNDAMGFCVTLRERTGVEVRLPTEAEWEYAARAGTTTPFNWGGELNGTQANCDGIEPYGTFTKGPTLQRTTPIGRYFATSPHPCGLVDVAGNVWEWCGDVYYSYPARGESVPLEPHRGSCRLLRGGGWVGSAWGCRSAARGWDEPMDGNSYLGFRLTADSDAFE